MAYRGVKQGSVQTGYFDNFAEGYPGQIATRDDSYLIDGYPAEGDLRTGFGVVQGTDIGLNAGTYNNLAAPYTVKAPDGASVGDDFVGIVIRNSSTKNNENGFPIWEDKDMTPIMRQGRVFVAANQAITADDDVWLIIADNGGHGFGIGTFSNVDLGSGDTVQITGARFWKAAAAGDVAIIELGR